MKPFLFCFLFSFPVYAFDNWLCTEEASERRANAIYSCGVGVSVDEGEARAKAYDNAEREFNKICEKSFDCKDHRISVEPKRNYCDAHGDMFRCYRLVVFSIGKHKKEKELAAEQDKETALETIVNAETPKIVQNVQSTPNPKVRIGMSKKEILDGFGKPESVTEPHSLLPTASRDWNYTGGWCLDARGCSIRFFEGEVEAYRDFKVDYTTDLE